MCSGHEDLRDFLRAQAAGRGLRWMGDFLRRHDPTVAAQVAAGQLAVIGVHPVTLNSVIRICGPDHSFAWPEAPDRFYARVNAMLDAWRSGWRPAPLIVTRSGRTVLNDGNHRLVCLQRHGVDSWPALTLSYPI